MERTGWGSSAIQSSRCQNVSAAPPGGRGEMGLPRQPPPSPPGPPLPARLRPFPLGVVVPGRAVLLHRGRRGVPQPPPAFLLVALVMSPEARVGAAIVGFEPLQGAALEVVARAAALPSGPGI